VKLPRDISGEELAGILQKYRYTVVRQTGSHIRLTSTFQNAEHHITIPKHKPLKVGTLSGIVNDIAAYLKIERKTLVEELFG
jgi:predicted RNA binding protein YcfA (HicA-like mRNA interferase family)